MSRFLFWLIDNVPLGNAAPWVFGLAVGRVPRRVGASPLVETKE